MGWMQAVVNGVRQRWVGAALAAVTVVLTACSSAPMQPAPVALPATVGPAQVKKVWSLRLGESIEPLQAAVVSNRVLIASKGGLVSEIDAESGQTAWRLQLKDRLQAGVGSDGRRHAVVSAENELIAIEGGREQWRQRLGAQSHTAPLVAGERVFVLLADRTVAAFDGATGQRLWAVQQRNASDALVLRQAGLLQAIGDTLLVGRGGRLAGLNPSNGQTRWEVLVGSSRGTNEVERLVDLVAGMNRQGQTVCVRSFQTAVGCVDAQRAQVVWTRPSQGHQEIDGDEARVYGLESDGKLLAWQRRDGQLAWSLDAYRFRGLTAPRVWGSALVMGDAQGLLHVLARTDGRTLERHATDGTPLQMQAVLAGRTLLTVNRSGLVTGWRID